jgi:hypothetical protein
MEASDVIDYFMMGLAFGVGFKLVDVAVTMAIRKLDFDQEKSKVPIIIR